MNLPEAFRSRMKEQLGDEYEAFISRYNNPPIRGLRINTLKLSKEEFLKLCPWKVKQADTLYEGLILDEEVPHIGTDPYHIAGLIYMQEPSAMSVIEHADIWPGMRVLDLCAAPGGKSGGIAARLNGIGFLLSNEIVPSRAKLLCQNLERLGVMNSAVTCAHPDEIASVLPCYFDRVIVDAPCSGEGMFRKDPAAIAEWSPEAVDACAVRQKAILESAAKLVSANGKLIYSTCTFSKQENEDVIEAFLSAHPEFMLDYMKRYYPHTCRGEGHFAARLTKRGGSSGAFKAFKPAIGKESARLVKGFIDETFSSFPGGIGFHESKNGSIYFLPYGIPDNLFKLRVLSFGIPVGEIVKNRLKPHHALFMASGELHEFGYECRNRINLGRNSSELLRFLSGNTIEIPPNLRGYCAVTADGFPVGFGKAVDGVLKNHLPKGLAVAAYR